MKIRNLSFDKNIFLAPMAGITDLPYRLIMKEAGASLVFSEMVSAIGLLHGGSRNKTRELLDSRPEERPLAVQLFGSEPEILAEAARSLVGAAECLDLNMGCPVPKVVKNGSGSALLRDPQRIARILATVRAAWDGPLTIKIRSGWDAESLNYLAIGRIAQEEGVDAVTLHPRTRSQGFSGHSDWAQLRALKEQLSIPVIGSGDVFSADDGLRMLQETGCDALMIGRGGYGNPWLIAELCARLDQRPWQPPTMAARAVMVHRHLELCLEIFGERKTLGEMRKHLCWYARGLDGAAAFRLGINNSESLGQMQQLVHDFFIEETPLP